MAEWSIATVCKTVARKGSAGSNPAPSTFAQVVPAFTEVPAGKQWYFALVVKWYNSTLVRYNPEFDSRRELRVRFFAKRKTREGSSRSGLILIHFFQYSC